VTLDEARTLVRFPVLLPSAPGLAEPDEVYVGSLPPGGQVALVYRARPGTPPADPAGLGLLITQFRGAVNADLVTKEIGPCTRVQAITVNGGRGFWIDGEVHAILYRDANGQFTNDQVRLAGNTLVWEQSGLIVRIEGARTKEEALAIAASTR
jgi:hypothetical protein